MSTVLFIKYILFDKSETFSSSVPPTPLHVNGKLPAQQIPAPSCPFNLAATSDSTLTTRRQSPLAIGRSVPAPTTLQGPLISKGMEKLLSDGMVLGSGVERTKVAALPPADATKLSREESDGNALTLTKNRSSARLQQLLLSEETSSVPRGLEPAVQCVSVGTQTELESPGSKSPIFTVGAPERKDPLPVAQPSQEPRLPPGLPLVPRQMEQCLAILKSDVSACRHMVIWYS